MYKPMDTASRLFSEAINRESRLGRNTLGSFATDLSSFVATEALMRFSRLQDATGVWLNNDNRILSRIQQLRTKSIHGVFGKEPPIPVYYEYQARVVGEVLAWWEFATDDPMYHNRDLHASDEGYGSLEWLDRYTFAIRNPNTVKYFEAGITDIALVERCVADGVDVDIALSLQSV